MSVYHQLRKLGLELPALPQPVAAYVPAMMSRGLIFASGQTPTKDGNLVYQGKVGAEVSTEDAYTGAQIAALNCLAELEHVLGDLDRVRRIVKLTGYVASAPGFGQQPRVINGASELLVQLWGERGHHARAAIGVSELPFNAPVEIELIAEIEE
jgi:enamine deaminase RidA (YjgF/YER057c/UK114 family)